MDITASGLVLPASLDDVNADFMTALLRKRGLISASNRVVDTEEADVGMTAGYFSSIKKVKCRYAEPTDAQDAFIVKAWPAFENAPKETIAGMFAKEIHAYGMDKTGFYPCPKVYLADCEPSSDRWALIMDDANEFGQQKLHENEMGLDEVLHMLPKMVDVAVAWEGCDSGEKSATLDAMDVQHWASPENLAAFKQIMPGGARLFDYVTNRPDSTVGGEPVWNDVLGLHISELFTNKIDAFYSSITPAKGATCTLSHGDLRGDNIFFCETSADYPDGWLTIDYQLLFRGPVPSDIAYLMNSGTVLPEVYSGDNREMILREFYDRFMQKTQRYPDYTWEQFNREYAVMASVLFVYYVGFGANIWQSGVNNELPVRIELGDRGDTEADLEPEELRQRMWWRKALANFRHTFRDYDHYSQLQALPDNSGEMGAWFDLPDRLRG